MFTDTNHPKAEQLNLMGTKPSTERFYHDVRSEYKRLSEVKRKGVQFYHRDYIMAYLAEKFYRSPKTIENILFHRV